MKEVQIGETAEGYVYYRLLSMGYSVHFASGLASPFDLFVDDGGDIIKIQVKGTATRARNKAYDFHIKKSNKQIAYSREDFDIIAYVCLQQERCIFSTDFVGKRTKRIRAERFCDEQEKKSWLKALRSIE